MEGAQLTPAGVGRGGGRRSVADDLVEPLDEARKLFGRYAPRAFAEPLGGGRANLRALGPRPLGETCRGELDRQREAGARFLTRDRERDHRAGSLVEDLVTQDQHRPLARLVVAAKRIEVRPVDLAPQYSGHAESPIR